MGSTCGKVVVVVDARMPLRGSNVWCSASVNTEIGFIINGTLDSNFIT